MKKILLFSTALLLAVNICAQDACHIVITGSFDSECLYDYKEDVYNEYPDVLIACSHSQVTYTAHIDNQMTAISYTWEVSGDFSHSASGDHVTVDWGGDGWGMLVVTVITTDGTVCTSSAYVKLIAAPTAVSSTVPAYTFDNLGRKVVRVCKGSRVEFIDHSDDEASDIAGHHWECLGSAPSSTPNYAIEVSMNDEVHHRVYNNCGCYDEEVYIIEMIRGVPLTLGCYGTSCEGAVVTYTAIEPSCYEYLWHVEGGTLVDGQGSSHPTVQWDCPQDGYGVLSLDGVSCGEQICPSMLSVKVPVIQDHLAIEGPRSICLGESAVYHLPLFGSTRYDWSITPTALMESDMEYSNEIRLTFSTVGTYHIQVTYQCDFLGCGLYQSEELVVEVRPNLAIEGQERICTTNSCDLHTVPSVSATWHAYDLGSGNAPVGTAVTGTSFCRTFSPGRYLITAEHPDHCGPATFVLVVKDTPPAPTVADLSPDNRHTACPNGGICLTGNPSEAHYSLVWTPTCTSASPQIYSGDSINIIYQNDVCNVRVYNYDRLLQCQSTAYYVHNVAPLVPALTELPTSGITVCPNSIVSFIGVVPDQRADGMLYEWKMEDNKQHCASVRGSHQQPDVTLYINDLNATTAYSFNVYLIRTYCNNQAETTAVNITVRNDLSANLSISGPTDVCMGTEVTYTGYGCATEKYSWIVGNTSQNGNPVNHSFNTEGSTHVALYCNPYDQCTNESYYVNTSIPVTVRRGPHLHGIVYDANTQQLSIQPCINNYTYTWYYSSSGSTPSPLIPVGYTCTHTPDGNGIYECVVTDNYGCSSSISTLYPIVDAPCSDMTLTEIGVDYCSGTIQVSASPHTSIVSWSIDGTGNISTSGTNNYIADVTLDNVGTCYVTANMHEGPNSCYEGSLPVTLDFIPSFSLSPLCGGITIHNLSQYLSSSETVYLSIASSCNATVDYVSFPVGQEYYEYTPSVPVSVTCVYTVYLIGFGANGNVINCPVGTITLEPPSPTEYPVFIYTNNPYDPDPPHFSCDNTPILLTASLNYSGASIVSSVWYFGDGGTYRKEGNSIYHTFKEKNVDYNINVTVTDSRGCVRSTSMPLSINSHTNTLASGNLLSPPPYICPHFTPPSMRIYFTPHDATNNHYTWTTPLTGTSHENYVSEPDIYKVSVVNKNFCKKEAAINVPFLPCPTARIHAESYNCCIGEPLPLYGSMAPAMGMQYLWSVTRVGGGYSKTFTTGDIVLTPPREGTYKVALTVTDNANGGCSSTAHTTITVHQQPPAPQLLFSGNSCISAAPVEVTATGYTGELHWSNGASGSTAYYYTPGTATAYAFDPTIGCPSLTGSIRIHHQPDFDGLLTGCYEKCAESLFNYYLPVYALTPDIFSWRWYLSGNTIATGADEFIPVLLPLNRPGTYKMTVDYQNGGCHATSPDLVVTEKDTCDCDGLLIDNLKVMTEVRNCTVLYFLTFDVCNDNNTLFCIDSVRVISDAGNVSIISEGCTGLSVTPNGCRTLTLTLGVTGLIPSSVLLKLTDVFCLHCTKLFSVNLDPEVDCNERLQNVSLIPRIPFLNDAAVYYYFETRLPAHCQPLAIWTEPAMVLDYHYDNILGTVDGFLMFDKAVLNQIANTSSDGEVCLRFLLCCGDVLCNYSFCVRAERLLQLRSVTDTIGPDDAEMYTPRPEGNGCNSLVLAGNPTVGEVSVVGTTDRVEKVLVLDMHGRHMASFEDGAIFNVVTLPSGIYIVCVTTRTDIDSPAVHHYLKLVKK